MNADDIMGFIIGSLTGLCIVIVFILYFSFKDMKECINDDICVNYYREYKKYDMHEDSFKIYKKNYKVNSKNGN